MVRRTSESGSASVVLIVVLIAAILGGVGFVAYRSLSKQNDAQVATPQQSQSTEAAQPMKDLTFANWGVSVSVPKDSTLYIDKPVEAETSSYDSYYAYDSHFDEVCGFDASTNSIAAVTRVKASDQVDSYVSDQAVTNKVYYSQHPDQGVVIDDYAYVYAKPNGGFECTDPSTAQGRAAGDVLGTATGSFYKAFRALHKG